MAITVPATDPLDFGNEPGQGPLRVGGREEVVAQRDSNLPSTRSKASADQQTSLRLVRDLWSGNETLHDRENAKTYLPSGLGEQPQAYQVRLKRSVYHNFFRRTIEGLTGLVFRKDPKLSTEVSEVIVEHWENIDNAGTHGDVFLRERLQDALCAGHNAILVDFPKTDGTQTRADEQGDIRPYWVPIAKEDIMSWRTSVRGGRMVLDQVVIRETTMIPDGEFGEMERVVYRVFRRDDQANVSVEVLAVTKDKRVFSLGRADYPTQDEIPLVEVATSGRKSFFVSDPPLLDFAWLNLAHYQQWSDQSVSIYKTCVPLLFLAGVHTADASTEDKAPLVVGPNTVITAENPAASGSYISHTGAALGNVKSALDDLKSDMGTLGLSMLSPQKRVAETAEAMRLDKSQSDSALAVTSRALQDAAENCLKFHARYLVGQPEGGEIEINRDFEGILIEANVMSAYGQLVAVGMPPRIALEMLKAGGRLREDADLDELEREWLVQQAAQEDQNNLERLT